MLRRIKQKFTRPEYLAMEEVALYKNEYHNGKIYAMVSGNSDQSLINVGLITQLSQHLRRTSCHVFGSDMRLFIETENLYTYAKAMVVCGKVEYETKRETTLTNPILIVEVLSQATRVYDRTDKFAFYKQLPTFQEYVLVESTEPHIEVRRKVLGRKWVTEHYKGLDAVVRLQSVDLEVSAREIYERAAWFK